MPNLTQLQQSLFNYFGFEQFRQGQAETISHLLERHSSLAIFPTGSGKSLCYQLTAMHLPNVTLVVSPLLALMQDQISFLNGKGIAAASLDSTQTKEQSQAVMQGVRNNSIKILMVSVERFKNERFREFIKQIPISMLVIDEAHCISEWGHNFRPDYLKLPHYRQEFNIPLVLLLTATATKKVKKDMAEKFAIADEHITQTGFYRNNLDLSVYGINNQDKLPQLINIVKSQTGAGIVYVTLQQQAEQLAKQLTAAGIHSACYHAGLNDETRKHVQASFMNNQLQVVVATIAFGMGVDKSNIRFVVHYELPKSIENYSQEIGRAGRDGQPSQCYVLANLDSIVTVENFIFGDTPELQGIEYVVNYIQSNLDNGSWHMQELQLSKLSNIRVLALKTLLVQLELLGAIEAQFAYYAELNIKLLHTEHKILSHFNETRQQFLQEIFANTHFKKIWGMVDIEAIISKGHPRDKVIIALDYLAEKGLIELASKKVVQVFAVNQQRLNDPELASSLYQYFKVKEQSELKRIATMIRFFELSKCLSANLAYYFDDYTVPEACGHCSVCRGSVAKLVMHNNIPLPDDDNLRSTLFSLQKHLAQGGETPSQETYIRFLTGVTTPIFTKFKLKQLTGFASCEGIRYHLIEAKLKQLGFIK